MYIARQPIFLTNKKVYGYELLFRGSKESTGFDGASATKATASVMANLFESGIDAIVEGKKAFINFNRELLMSDLLELLSKDQLVVEVLEHVKVDELLIMRMKTLHERGYEIALDDFVETYEDYPLVPFAKIIKFDIVETPLDTLEDAVAKALGDRKILLAEKIETEEDFQRAKAMGFHLFQGYFFSKPTIVGRKNETKTTSETQYIRIMQELKKEEPSYQILAEIIEKDVNLSYRLMRVISGRVGDDLIYSIKRALTYMGLSELERWVKVLMLQELGVDKPKELMRLSLVRSKLSELIATASNLKKAKYEASMLGLFSAIDAILDTDMEEAVKDLSISPLVITALLNQQGALLVIRQLIDAYENGQWQKIDVLAKEIHMDKEVIFQHYLASVKWAKEVMEVIY